MHRWAEVIGCVLAVNLGGSDWGPGTAAGQIALKRQRAPNPLPCQGPCFLKQLPLVGPALCPSPQLYAFATEYPGTYMDSKDDGLKVGRRK